MTDEQWLWLFVNEAIDYDEQLERMCPKCQNDATSHRCIRCGKSLGKDKFGTPDCVNPNFDVERFNRLSNGTHDCDHDDDVDYDLIDKIIGKE